MSISEALNFSQLLMTKFCHDITGPIGAINNGVECINEDASMRDAGMDLISTSASQAIARIQFYRFAYGILKGINDADMEEKRTQAAEFFNSGRVTLHWPRSDIAMPQKQCQILYNMLLIASGCLIRGGDMTISLHPHKVHTDMEVKATGSHIAMHDRIYHAITDRQHLPDNKSVQAYYLRMLVDSDIGATLDLAIDEESCVLRYHPDCEG